MKGWRSKGNSILFHFEIDNSGENARFLQLSHQEMTHVTTSLQRKINMVDEMFFFCFSLIQFLIMTSECVSKILTYNRRMRKSSLFMIIIIRTPLLWAHSDIILKWLLKNNVKPLYLTNSYYSFYLPKTHYSDKQIFSLHREKNSKFLGKLSMMKMTWRIKVSIIEPYFQLIFANYFVY